MSVHLLGVRELELCRVLKKLKVLKTGPSREQEQTEQTDTQEAGGH